MRPLHGAAALALLLALAGGAAAQESEELPPEQGEETVADGGEMISGGDEPVSSDESVIIVDLGGEELPPGFCDDCVGDGALEGEVLATSVGATGSAGYGRTTWSGPDGNGASWVGKAAAPGGENLCTSRQFYVAWLCDWQGYSRP